MLYSICYVGYFLLHNMLYNKKKLYRKVYNGFPGRLGGAAGERDGGRPPVGSRFRQPDSDRTPFFRLNPAFGFRSRRKTG